MKALDIDLHNILTKYTKLVKKNNEYFINNTRVLISIPSHKYLIMFVNKKACKIDKNQFYNAIKFVCFVKKTGEYLVRPVDCEYTLTLHIYNSNWIIDKNLVNFKEIVPFVCIPKNITIYGNNIEDKNDRGFCWSRLDSSQQPQNTVDTDWGGFSGGYNPFR